MGIGTLFEYEELTLLVVVRTQLDLFAEFIFGWDRAEIRQCILRSVVMDVIDELEIELRQAEAILDTQYSFDLAEPCYERILEIIDKAPEERGAIVELLRGMLIRGDITDEPVAYLMHALRWLEVRDWAQARIEELSDPFAHGRQFQKILAAYSDSWESRIFYKRFRR